MLEYKKMLGSEYYDSYEDAKGIINVVIISQNITILRDDHFKKLKEQRNKRDNIETETRDQ